LAAIGDEQFEHFGFLFGQEDLTQTPGEEAHGSASYVGNVASLPNCSYEVRISAELKLTNGEHQHDNIWDRVLFCK
jgi:hypothetical protein